MEDPKDAQPKRNVQNINNQENESEWMKIDKECENKSEENKNQEAVASESIEQLSEEIENILTSINATWEYDKESYLNYFKTEVRPKITQWLSYSCLNSNQEIIKLIYRFLCKYYLERQKYLKEIPKEELENMIDILQGNSNIFSIKESELIFDKSFNAIFKELLPDKEFGIISEKNKKNSMYKSFIGFVFQCGFIENYLDKVLFRNDILPTYFSKLYSFPGNLLYLLDNNFLKNKNLSLKIISSINRMVDNNQTLKNDDIINNIQNFSSNFFEQALTIFNFNFDELLKKNQKECQIYSTLYFNINQHFLRHQKINNRFTAMKNISNLCKIYLDFLKKEKIYSDYINKYENAEQAAEFLIQEGIECLDKIKIFDFIFGDNIHEGLIQRSYETLSLLYKYNKFNSEHINILWNLSQTKYTSISNEIMIILGKLLPEFSLEDCNSILKNVDNMPFNKVNEITLKLFENFFKGNTRRELVLNILLKFSNELKYEQGLNKNIILKSRDILVKLLMSDNYSLDLVNFIKKSIFYVHKFYLVDTYSSILQLILEKLPAENNNNNYIYMNFGVEIKTFKELINFLDEKYKLFPIYMNYLKKIIQLFKFFYEVSIKILNEINNGNFELENLFNVDNLYFEYIIYIENNMNFQYNLNNNDEDSMDIEINDNKSNINNDDFFLDKELKLDIMDNEQENYIKNLIKDYAIFLKDFIKANNLPSPPEIKFILFKQLKLDFHQSSFFSFIEKIIKAIIMNCHKAKLYFKYDYFKFLYEIAKNTSDIDNTLSWYYSLLKEIFLDRIQDNNDSIIDDNTMEKLISEQIINCDIEQTHISIFSPLLQYVQYINQKNNNATYSKKENRFTEIKNFKNFLYFDSIWEFYTKTENDEIFKDSYKIIINILELISKNDQDRNEFINKIFNFITKNKYNVQNNFKIKKIFIRTLKVISILLGEKINEDYNTSHNNDSYEKQMNIINMKEKYTPTENELKEGYSVIKLIFGDNLYFGEDIMKEAIIEFKGNSTEAGLYLTVPENVEKLQNKIQNKICSVKPTEGEIICLEEKKIDLLIEILNNNIDREINLQVWELFSKIKYSDDIVQKIIGGNIEQIFNNQNQNRFILYLEIINSLIFGSDFCKYNILTKESRNIWISNFIKNKTLIKKIFIILNTLETQQNNEFFLFKYLNIFTIWLHKIMIKIGEKLESTNENTKNIMTEIMLFREMNKNKIDIGENDNNEFEIINNDDAMEFLRAINEIKGYLIFYNMILLVVRFKSIKDKIILMEKISEFLIISLMLQKDINIKIFSEEKKTKVLTQILTRFEGDIEPYLIKNLLKILVRNLDGFFSLILESLIKEINSGVTMNDEFCDFFSYLLVFKNRKDLNTKLIEPLLYKFIKDIITLCSGEEKYDERKRDKISQESYLLFKSLKFYEQSFIDNINRVYKEQKIDFIVFLYDLLTISKEDIEKRNYNKHIDNQIKDQFFKILGILTSRNKKLCIRLLIEMTKVYKAVDKNTSNKIEMPNYGNIDIRSKEQKLIGLRNFSCTCYLNSLIQQFFMMPSFKKDLFNNFIFPEGINYNEDLKNSVIYNLQLTFQNLKCGSMNPYPPLRFITSFKSAFNGQPIQLNVQQDSEEFLSILCENLEREAKNINKELFLENSIKGKISNETISLEKDYPYYSQTEEDFYSITLDIKGHRNLEEALDAYVKAVILEGDNKYYIDKYKTKISIKRSNSLKTLGNVVIIHLKRFEYDFLTFNNRKLNNYLKFPSKINFKKWTRIYLRANSNNNDINKESLNIKEEEKLNLLDDNMDYILTGVLVHSGYKLQSGHYFSYIMDQETGNWYEFNDDRIIDYNINNLEKDCFGNNDEGKAAYLLFYTKKNIFRNKSLFQNINISKTILDDVYNENLNFLIAHIYLNQNYFIFMLNYIQSGIKLLEGEKIPDNEEKRALTNYLIKNNNIYIKILSKFNLNEKDYGENNICNSENFDVIYNECKEEVESLMIGEKKNKKRNFKKNLIKLYFNYFFKIIYPYCKMQKNKESMIASFKILIEIIENNDDCKFLIAKQIEKNINLFTELIKQSSLMIYEYGELSILIFKFFQIIFNYIYNCENNSMKLTSEVITYFKKNEQGKYVIVKEYKSITIRLIKKLLCDNIDKGTNIDLDGIYNNNIEEIQKIIDLNEIFFGNEKDKNKMNQIYDNENIAQKIIIFMKNVFLSNNNRFFIAVSKIIKIK